MWNLFITFVTQFIPAVWLAATHEVTQLTNFIGPRARHYWNTFLWLAVVAIGTPICLTGLAILTKAGWLIALIGLLLACFLAIMLFRPVYVGLTVLLGAVWSLLNGKLKGAPDVSVKWAKAYINIVGGFLLWELLVIFFISVFPIWNNLAALPIIALCSVLLPLMISIWGLGGRIFRRVAYLFVLFVLIFEIGSLAFPLSGRAIIDKRPKMDEKMAKWIENPTLPKLNTNPQTKIQTKVAGEKIIPVTLSSEKWSPPVYLPACQGFDIVGPPGAVYRFEVDRDKKEYPVGKGHFPNDTRFQEGIRYKGLPGMDGRNVYIRIFPQRNAPDTETVPIEQLIK